MQASLRECASRCEALESRVPGKRARPVRREAVGKGPSRRDLAGGPPNRHVREVAERLLTRQAQELRQVTVPAALKLIKRQGYGRASLDTLKRRFLPAA